MRRLPAGSIRRVRLAAAFAALGLLSGCKGAPKPVVPTFPGAPLVVVSIDTLRSDRLPAYGYAGVETPALSAFRDDAVLFERAFSHVPLTLPSHASLFTGALPAVHGLRDNAGYRLDPTVPTLAELLKRSGYDTAAAVSSVVLSGESGIARGFDRYDDAFEATRPWEPLGRVQRAGAESAARLAAWLGARADAKARPAFLFLHVYEPHAPYAPPEPFRSRWGATYEGEIAAADAAVGGFLDELKRRGLYDRALVVVLSDHGEGLGEHGESEHGVFLYREALQVPLLVKLPKAPGASRPPLAGRSVATPVGLTDVFTTAVQGLDVPGAPPRPETLSLFDLAFGLPAPERRLYAESLYPRLRLGWSDLASLRDARWHLIAAPRPELFDSAVDPGERKNLAPEKPPALRALTVEMEARRAPFREPSAAVSVEEAKKLASLGYLTGSASSSGPLADPKDEIASLELLREAGGLLDAGRAAEAAEAFRRLLERSPRAVDGWELYAQALARLGRGDEAFAALKRTVTLAPENARYLLAVANLLLQLGRFDDGLAHARRANERGEPGAAEVVARAYLAKGDLGPAEAWARRSLEGGRVRRRSLLVLARVAQLRGDAAGALALADRVKADLGAGEDGGLAGLHLLRGDLLATLGRLDEAEAEMRAELRLFPDSPTARRGLEALAAARRSRPAAAPSPSGR